MGEFTKSEENVKVIIRVRPRLGKSEYRKTPAIQMTTKHSIQVADTNKSKGQMYSSNAVFDGRADNEIFFNACGVKGLVESTIAGYR